MKIKHDFFFFQSLLDRQTNNIKLSWEASCTVIDQSIGYVLHYQDMTTTRKSQIQISKTVETRLTQTFKENSVKYGTEYQFWVETDVQNAQKSNVVSVKTLALPIPEMLTSFQNVNTSKHDIRWKAPSDQHLTPYLQKQLKNNKVSYRYVSRGCS